VWLFDVAKNFASRDVCDLVRLEFSGAQSVPSDFEIRLIDYILLKEVDLREVASYSFFLGRRDFVRASSRARFGLIIGSDVFIDEQLNAVSLTPVLSSLGRCFPNPFTAGTVIRYDIHAASEVRVRVFDVNGALVRILEEGKHEPGRYETVWSGESSNGGRAAPGIYFCQMETSTGIRKVRKTILLR
jgi:hypothetical protein